MRYSMPAAWIPLVIHLPTALPLDLTAVGVSLALCMRRLQTLFLRLAAYDHLGPVQ